MNKKIILIFSFNFILFSIIAQTNFQWSKSIGSLNDDRGQSVVVDNEGNVYTVGTFIGTVDFDPGAGLYNLTSAGWIDIFITKLDSLGTFIWAKKIGGPNDDFGYSISLDKNGNIYTTGYFSGITDFDPGAAVNNLTSAGMKDIFISKMDTAGNFIWAKQFGGTNNDIGLSIIVDTAGSIYSTGHFYGTVDFDPNSGVYSLSSSTAFSTFVSKLNSSGGFVWAKCLGGTQDSYGQSIALDLNQNLYLTGAFKGTVDFDPSSGISYLSSSGLYDIFICKLNFLGDLVWAKKIGGAGTDLGNDIVIDVSGNIFTTGVFQTTVDFDPGSSGYNLVSAGYYDIYVNKLDSFGAFIWAKPIGSTDNDYGKSISIDFSGNVYITGYYIGTVDFDSGPPFHYLSSEGAEDVFISKLNSSGNFVWAKSIGSNMEDFGNCITVNNIGNVYLTGYYSNTADFDPGTGASYMTPGGAADAFIIKLGDFSVGIKNNPELINSLSAIYPNPNNGNCALQLNFENQIQLQIEVFDITGKLVQTISHMKLNNGSGFILINVSELKNGIYFLKVYNEKINETFKVIINK